ncbi:zinc transporter 2-like [Dreissena polymorpha]|uniref:zinc transporter 2-like n=1 Tax=Dreissena polymorpha TaxID=45954 RepID=UPI0022649368|nr:zinc transporter 2-like [Dreissena polymorpha]
MGGLVSDSKEKAQLLCEHKAFDTVPHKKVLQKLEQYGINGNINHWLEDFLTDRSMKVVVEGDKSEPATVDPGVPQRTVLGPLLFLCHINDLPDSVKSSNGRHSKSPVPSATFSSGHMINKMADLHQPVSSENILNSKTAADRKRCTSCTCGIHVPNYEYSPSESLLQIPSHASLATSDTHCHERKSRPDIDRRARRKLIIACVLSLCFMIAEVLGGILAHSLAIVSDAAHLLTDLASFLISLLAVYLSSRRATKKLSFGWYRAEILGALMSILFLWVVTGVLCYMAVERVIDRTFEVNATIMLITAACGVAFNLLMGITLHGGHGHSHGGHHHSNHKNRYSGSDTDIEKVRLTSEESIQESSSSYGALSNASGSDYKLEVLGTDHKTNINVKAAFIHVIGDLIQSIGVLIAAFIIYFKPEWKLADPICTFVFSVIVLVTTVTIMRDILVVLMEGTPRSVNFKAIQQSLKGMAEVKEIHDLRIWSLSMDKVALSVHIAVARSSDIFAILQKASLMIRDQFGITNTTIQVEEYVTDMLDCTHCKDLPD